MYFKLMLCISNEMNNLFNILNKMKAKQMMGMERIAGNLSHVPG